MCTDLPRLELEAFSWKWTGPCFTWIFFLFSFFPFSSWLHLGVNEGEALLFLDLFNTYYLRYLGIFSIYST